jgi:hypothetical protein
MVLGGLHNNFVKRRECGVRFMGRSCPSLQILGAGGVLPSFAGISASVIAFTVFSSQLASVSLGGPLSLLPSLVKSSAKQTCDFMRGRPAATHSLISLGLLLKPAPTSRILCQVVLPRALLNTSSRATPTCLQHSSQGRLSKRFLSRRLAVAHRRLDSV